MNTEDHQQEIIKQKDYFNKKAETIVNSFLASIKKLTNLDNADLEGFVKIRALSLVNIAYTHSENVENIGYLGQMPEIVSIIMSGLNHGNDSGFAACVDLSFAVEAEELVKIITKIIGDNEDKKKLFEIPLKVLLNMNNSLNTLFAEFSEDSKKFKEAMGCQMVTH